MIEQEGRNPTCIIYSVDDEMDKTILFMNQQSGYDKKHRSWVGNRRLFLGLAAIGIGVLSYTAYDLAYNTAKKSSSLSTSSLMSSSSASFSLTSSSLTSSSLTSTSKELVSLEGELYVGWDGNGIKKEEYSPLSDEGMVLVRVGGGKNPEIFAEATSDSSGL